MLALDGSECTIKWKTQKKASSHSITDVFPTALHSIPSLDSASQALLYLESEHEATDPKTSLRSAAQHNTQTKLFLLVQPPPHGGLLIGGAGNGAPPPSKSNPYAIIYNPRAETKHVPKVYDAAPLNDRLGELIRAFIFVLINHGSCAKI